MTAKDEAAPQRGGRIITTRRAVIAAASAAAIAVPVLWAASDQQAVPDDNADVIVVGGGAAGAVAALFAHEAGARVIVIEAADYFGGTAAKSGGNIWVPNNSEMRKRGVTDSKEDFLRMAAQASYPDVFSEDIQGFGLSPAALSLLSTFYENAASTIDTLAAMNALKTRRFHFGSEDMPKAPDYYDDLRMNPGSGKGRVLSPVTQDGAIGVGDELMAQLGAALAARSIPVRLNCRATRLIAQDGAVVGVEALANERQVRLMARRGVIFTTGGFTHNPEFLSRFHANPVLGGCAIPTCRGDFVAIAERAGAQLGNMSGAWRAQVILDDVVMNKATPQDIWVIPGDSVILVNRHGRRTMNEKRNYHSRAKAMYAVDANTGGYNGLIQFLIYDARAANLWAGYHPFPPFPDGADHILSGQTLEVLSAAIMNRLKMLGYADRGISLADDFVSGLRAEIGTFAEYAKQGRDRQFGRGSEAYDQYYHAALAPQPSADWPTNDLPNPTMYPFSATGPYYAIIIGPGTLDTNGGPIIDEKAQVLNADGKPIPGLFGAGNCIASPARDSYWAAGATLANAMTFGAIAGRTAAARGKT